MLLRSLDASDFDTIDPVETFIEIDTPLAIVKTTDKGDKLFDSIRVDESTTHIFCVQHTVILDQVEYQNYFIDLNGLRYKILAVTNIDEKDEVLAIQAVKRGHYILEASQA